jgi:hypothetical protein
MKSLGKEVKKEGGGAKSERKAVLSIEDLFPFKTDKMALVRGNWYCPKGCFYVLLDNHAASTSLDYRVKDLVHPDVLNC